MKKIITIACMLFAFGTVANAQVNELEYIKSEFNADKKTLLMNYLSLSDSQAAKFWPIYTKYEQELSALADKRFSNMKSYADQYKTITNEQADAIVKNFFENESKKMALEKKYYSQFKKAVGAKTATSWLQFEEYLSAAIRFDLLNNIPFVKGK